MIPGFGPSFDHNQNGMTRSDMEATKRVADRLDEFIIFRSTGPWSKRWLNRGYPSKNFQVKGKSSDWGPHAGLVPYDGVYSKVGYDAGKAAKGTVENIKGLNSGFASRTPLMLTREQIQEQLTEPEGNPKRTAMEAIHDVPGSKDKILIARRSGDKQLVAFRAVAQADGSFEIRLYPIGSLIPNINTILDKDRDGKRSVPFEVMTSNEIGAGLPMTGDYVLFAICPSWAQYGSTAPRDIVKAGIQNADGQLHKGVAFRAGQGMDNVLDPSLNTQSRKGDFGLRKDARLGAIGALTRDDMTTIQEGESYGDGFPLTVFQPRSIYSGVAPSTHFKTCARYGDVCTLEDLEDFKAYAGALKASGYYVPKNWIWGV